MKKLSLSIVTALVFFVATAMAQTTPATDPQGTTPPAASPSTQTSTPEAQTPAAQPATAPAAGTQSASPADTKGDKKLKGCIESENGKFVLEAKHGKEITLTGQDVSGHVGHQVVLHGTFQNSMAASASGETAGTAASAGSTSTSSTAGSTDVKSKAGQEFNVTSIDMVSATCKDKDMDKSGEKHEHDKSSTQPPQ
jgi:hypothetical protein